MTLDESLLDKDLYRTLGLEKSATAAEIKRAYRKLAQVHHPDKVSASRKDINAEIFRDIAQAYEVLNNAGSRAEYDELMQQKEYINDEKIRRHRFQHQHQQQQQQQQQQQHQRQRQQRQRQQQQQQQQQQQAYREENIQRTFEQFSALFESLENDVEPGWGEPYVIGHILPAGRVIFPFSPIVTSPDASHFMVLDYDCRIGVYKGDVRDLVQHLQYSRDSELDSTVFELLFQTRGDESLRGNCFAGLDDTGLLQVFDGHPDFEYSSLWSSELSEGEEDQLYANSFSRYYLELTSNGELAVLKLKSGEPEPHCVWSTMGCNKYMALFNEARIEAGRLFKGLARIMAQVVKETKSLVEDIFGDERLREILFSIKMWYLEMYRSLKTFVQSNIL